MEEALDLMPFNFTISSLLAGLVFGAIGIWLFRKAKRESKIAQVLIALALMIYPYFTQGRFFDWGVGFALCGLAYYLEHRE